MRNWTAWIGAKYGTLTVEKYLGNQGTKNTFFLVRCDCGKTKKVITSLSTIRNYITLKPQIQRLSTNETIITIA